jgi:hypothetical protein
MDANKAHFGPLACTTCLYINQWAMTDRSARVEVEKGGTECIAGCLWRPWTVTTRYRHTTSATAERSNPAATLWHCFKSTLCRQTCDRRGYEGDYSCMRTAAFTANFEYLRRTRTHDLSIKGRLSWPLSHASLYIEACMHEHDRFILDNSQPKPTGCLINFISSKLLNVIKAYQWKENSNSNAVQNIVVNRWKSSKRWAS